MEYYTTDLQSNIQFTLSNLVAFLFYDSQTPSILGRISNVVIGHSLHTLSYTFSMCTYFMDRECWHFCCSGAEDIELWFSEVENLLSVEDDSGKVGDEDRGNSVNIAQCTWRGWAWEEEQEVGSRMSFLESFQYFASYFKTFELNVCKGWTKCSCPTSAVVFWNLILNSFTALVSLFK